MTGQRSPHHDLLLIPSAQLPDLLVEAAGDNAKLFHQTIRYTLMGSTRNDSPARESIKNGERQILTYAEVWDKTTRVTVLRHIGDAPAQEIGRAHVLTPVT